MRLIWIPLALLLAGCPAPGPAPKPRPSPATTSEPAQVESKAPVAVEFFRLPAGKATPKPPPPQESPGLRLRLVRPKPGSVVRYGPIDVRLEVIHEEALEAVRVNGREAEWRFSKDVKPAKGQPKPVIPLQRTQYQLRLKYPVQGENPLALEVEDQAGRVARRTETFTFRPPDGIPPTITLVSPKDGAALNKAPVVVAVKVDDPGGVARVTINGAEVTIDADLVYRARMPRPRGGVNRLRIDAWDRLGNQATLRSSFRYRSSDTSPPTIQVIEPDKDVAVRESPVQIVVRVVDDDGVVSGVRINGKPAKRGKDGFYRHAIKFPLVGLNPVRIVAWDPAGNRATVKTQFRFE